MNPQGIHDPEYNDPQTNEMMARKWATIIKKSQENKMNEPQNKMAESIEPESPQDAIMAKLSEVQDLLNTHKPKTPGGMGRNYAIALTELEKLQAWVAWSLA